MSKPHVEDLYAAMQRFMNAQQQAVAKYIRQPETFEASMSVARAEFREWCKENGLELDWTER